MIKLIERMRVSHLETLNVAKEMYPYSVTPAIKELETKGFWSDLTYETVGILVSHLRLKGYEPHHISEVFDNV